MPTKTVNFPATKAGLATVGYRIVSSLGSVGSRVTTGVYEIGGGAYGADIAAGTGSIRWDTGEAVPMYATDEQTPMVNVKLINDAAATPGTSPGGSGADTCTLTLNDSGGDPIPDADVWITSDSGGLTVVAGTLQTDSNGQVTFLLDAGDTYYLWAQKDGTVQAQGASFVAVAD